MEKLKFVKPDPKSLKFDPERQREIDQKIENLIRDSKHRSQEILNRPFDI